MDLMERKRLLDERIRRGAHLTKEATDGFLQDYVVNPLTEAGYPNVGAGIGAAGSAIVDLSIPEDTMQAALNFVPGGKIEGAAIKSSMTAAPKTASKFMSAAELVAKNEQRLRMALAKDANGVARTPEQIERALGQLRTQDSRLVPEITEIAPVNSLVKPGVEELKAANATEALTVKPKIDTVVHDASSIEKIPDASMKYNADKAEKLQRLRQQQGLLQRKARSQDE